VSRLTDIVSKVLKSVIEACTIGASILEICQKGDKLIEEAVSKVYVKDKNIAKGK
jgi:methionine aminopeptidase